MDGGLDLFTAAIVDSDEGALRVSEVTKRARQIVESGLSRIWVRGEVSGFKSYRSGHWYFALRDAVAQVRCVMWRQDNQRLPRSPSDGTEVFVEALPTVWEERGEFRLTVRQLVATDADGLWQAKLEKARRALERDGLLEAARKRPLPVLPRRIAVVTSLDGAALRDIVTVVARRWPATDLLVVPTRVQGDGAAGELCAALKLLARIPNVDLAIVGRGGGSREDLWAFNSERVARAVAGLPMPCISAVGHETDVSLTDLVADLRAPTPSAAAESAVPDRDEMSEWLDQLARQLGKGLASRARVGKERLARTADRMTRAMQLQMDRRSLRLEHLADKLDSLSPLRLLQRGYAVARDEQGKVLKRRSDFSKGSDFRLTLADGDVHALTTKVE